MHLGLQLSVDLLLLEYLRVSFLEKLFLSLDLELLLRQVLVGVLGLCEYLLELTAQLLQEVFVLQDDEVLLDLYQLVR